MDASGASDESVLPWRTEKSCGPDASTLASSLQASRLASDGDKKARSPGRSRRKPLKPLRREGRTASAEPVCSCALSLPFLHARPRVQRAPGFPCALVCEEGVKKQQTSGAIARRDREVSAVSAVETASALRSDPAEVNPLLRWSRALGCGEMDCFAASRNDGGPTRQPPPKVSGITINYSPKPPAKPPVARANGDAVGSSTDRRRCCPKRRRTSAGHLNPSGDDPCPSVLHFSPPPPSARWP